MRRLTRAASIAAVSTAFVAAATLSGGAAAFATDTGAPPNSSHFAQGFDVSAYQTLSASDFTSAKSNGASFAYIKAGQTVANHITFQQDSTFTSNWQDAVSAGIVPGAYFFVGIGDGNKNHIANFNAKTEASNMITAATRTPQVQPQTLPPVIDLEEGATTTCRLMDNTDWKANLAANQKMMVQWIQTFSTVIKNGFGGRTPIIYTDRTFWSTCTGNSTAFAANRLWIASPTAVGSSAVRPSVTSMGFSNFLLWQWRYDASDVPPGFPGDQDVLNTAVSSLATLSTPPIPTAPTPTISGSAQWHQTVTAKPGSWTSGTTFTYQWFRNGAAISGATGASYTIASADIGKTLTVHVTGHHTGYSPVIRSSNATAAITV